LAPGLEELLHAMAPEAPLVLESVNVFTVTPPFDVVEFVFEKEDNTTEGAALISTPSV
jgi:hypothetical protein